MAVAWVFSAAAIFATNIQLLPVTTSDIQFVQWPSGAISWSLNPSNNIVYKGSGILATETDLQTVLNAAFTLWSSAQYQSTNVNTLAFTQGADNSNSGFVNGDCVNSIGFTQNLGATGVIALTEVTEYFSTPPPFTYPCTAAPTSRTCPSPYEVCISDADIEFNTTYNFTTPSYSQSGYYDLQTVATHEIGHLMGLDHSGLANAIMYPYGDTGKGGVKSALSLDDEIGSAILYGSNAIMTYAGTIKGTVTVGGSPAFAAHVVAIDSTTGNVVTDTLSDTSGNYKLRTFAGTYYVLVLPLASDTSGDSSTNGVTSISNYHGFACAYATTYSTCGGLPSNPTNYTGVFY